MTEFEAKLTGDTTDDTDSIWSESSQDSEIIPHCFLIPPVQQALKRRHIPIVSFCLDSIETQLNGLLDLCFPNGNWGPISISRISGAMTNCVYAISVSRNESIFTAILRIYGVSSHSIIHRDHEMLWFCRMAELGLGPKLLAVFENGRFEQFMESDTLTKNDLRDPLISVQIARALQRLVSFKGPHAHMKPILWHTLRSWLSLVQKDVHYNVEFASKLQEASISLPRLGHLINAYQTQLESLGTVVFSHNDLQYGNILKMKDSGDLILVDFEYSGFSYREYDIANHFCEWAADYHSTQPHLMNFDRFPNVSEQTRFLGAYLNLDESSTEVLELRVKVLEFVKCSHLLWGLWGLHQAANADTSIEFDYLEYGLQRLALL